MYDNTGMDMDIVFTYLLKEEGYDILDEEKLKDGHVFIEGNLVHISMLGKKIAIPLVLEDMTIHDLLSKKDDLEFLLDTISKNYDNIERFNSSMRKFLGKRIVNLTEKPVDVKSEYLSKYEDAFFIFPETRRYLYLIDTLMKNMITVDVVDEDEEDK